MWLVALDAVRMGRRCAANGSGLGLVTIGTQPGIEHRSAVRIVAAKTLMAHA